MADVVETEQELQAATGTLDDLIGYNLKRVYVYLLSGFKDAQVGEGLPPRMFSALSLVVENPKITQSDLARALGIERSGLVSIVDQLEKLGYLERRMVPGDRRAQALSPTSRGAALLNESRERIEAHEKRALRPLTDAEQEELLRLLRKVRGVD